MSSRYFGNYSDFIGSNLQTGIESGGYTPLLKNILLQGKKEIGKLSSNTFDKIAEAGTQSGFRGVNANLYNKLFENTSNAVGSLETSVGQLGQSNLNTQIAQLFGLTQFQGNQAVANDQLELQKKQVELQKKAQEQALWSSIIGNTLGVAGSVAGNWEQIFG